MQASLDPTLHQELGKLQCPRGLVRFPRLGQKRTSSGRIVSIVSGGEIVSAKWARAAVTLDGNHVFTGHEPMRRSSVGP